MRVNICYSKWDKARSCSGDALRREPAGKISGIDVFAVGRQLLDVVDQLCANLVDRTAHGLQLSAGEDQGLHGYNRTTV